MPYADPSKQQEYLKDHYSKNRDSYASASHEARVRRRLKLREAKKGPCEDCDLTYHPDVMDFHHPDPSVKDAAIGAVMNKWGWSRIEAEIAKCVLLCSNCHRLRHAVD